MIKKLLSLFLYHREYRKRWNWPWQWPNETRGRGSCAGFRFERKSVSHHHILKWSTTGDLLCSLAIPTLLGAVNWVGRRASLANIVCGHCRWIRSYRLNFLETLIWSKFYSISNHFNIWYLGWFLDFKTLSMQITNGHVKNFKCIICSMDSFSVGQRQT